MANPLVVKHKITGRLYEIQHIDGDIYACLRLSYYDGMPIGDLVYLRKDEVE